MTEATGEALRGKRLLVVEDEYLIASDLASVLECAGADVVGPAATVEDALRLIETDGERLDGAVLDVNLRSQFVFPVADELAARGVRFVLTTGYDEVCLPPAYAGVARCEKPVRMQQLMGLLAF